MNLLHLITRGQRKEVIVLHIEEKLESECTSSSLDYSYLTMLFFISLQDTEAMIGDKFVIDIRNFVSEVSDHAAPACLMLFGVNYTLGSTCVIRVDCIQFYAYVCVCVFMLYFVGGYSCHRTYH